MARFVALAASPRSSSRSRALLEIAIAQLRTRGAEVDYFRLEDFVAEDLLASHVSSPSLAAWCDAVARADGLLLATPVYKASFSAGLKALLDVLPERGLKDKVVLTLSTGGSKRHQLAVDHGLRPVLSVLKAITVSESLHACEEEARRDSSGQLQWQPAVLQRLEKVLQQFWRQLPAPRGVDQSQLRRSILAARISV